MLKRGQNPHEGSENEESVREKGGKSHGWHNLSECVLKIGQTEHEKHKNGENVLEYHLWTPKWKEMLQNSKFNETGDFPIAYKLLLNMGGDKHEGYVGFQDHGDDVWYRNVRIKIRD